MSEGNLSPLAALHRQMAMELKASDSNGLLYRLPGESPDPLPRLLTAHLADSTYVAYFRADLPTRITAELRSLTPRQLYEDVSSVQRILDTTDQPWRGRTYVFLNSPPLDEYPQVIQRNDRFVIEADGLVASEAWSSLSNDIAAELAVETHPAFRRRGCARQVSAAWAAHQLSAQRTPFYSHTFTNFASAALARSLTVHYRFDIADYD